MLISEMPPMEKALDTLQYIKEIEYQFEDDLTVAIQALEQANADGCEGCKYQGKDEFEQPCLICKRSKKDYWRSSNDER